MQPLADKYKPSTLADLIGVPRAKAILQHFAAAPYPSAWLFLGESGLGKTTAALALARAIGAEVHRLPSKTCDMAAVNDVCHMCHYVPLTGPFHAIIVDEADQMSHAAQLAFLSKLDGTATPPATIFLFTANETSLLKNRFLSRVRTVRFTPDGLVAELPAFLQSIFEREALGARFPDFARIAEESEYNIRQALMNLEIELIAPEAPVETVRAKPETIPAIADRITAPEVAAALRVKLETVYRYITRGVLPKPTGRPMYWERRALEPKLTELRA
jgi:replication factor C small subunit